MLWWQDPDVLVVGAGPVGLATALLLAERGVKVELIDEADGPERFSVPSLLHPSTLQLLDDVGAAGELLEQGARVERVVFHDQRGPRATAHLDALGSEFPFMLSLPRGVLEAALEHRLAALHVRIRWAHRLAALAQKKGRIEATIEALGIDSGGYGIPRLIHVVDGVRHVPVRFVVGADGFHSTVRRLVDIESEPTGEPAVYADLELRGAPLGGEIHVHLDDGVTSVGWPLPNGRARWLLELHRGEQPVDESDAELLGTQSWRGLERESIELLLRARSLGFEPGQLEHSERVRFAPSAARRLSASGAYLIGDAAHVAPPAGAHSLNMGLLEAHDLASRLARVLRADADRGLLEQFERERLRGWRELLDPLLSEAATPWIAEHASHLNWCLPVAAQAQLNGQLDFGELAVVEPAAIERHS